MGSACCGSGSSCCPDKKVLLWGLVMAVLYFGLDMFFHGFCMHKLYMEHAALFRPMDAMKSLQWYGWAGYLLFGFLFTCIYSKGYEAEKSGLTQGLRYGFWVGLFYWGTHLLGSYHYTLIPGQIVRDWFVIGMAEFLVLGFLLGALYKPVKTV